MTIRSAIVSPVAEPLGQGATGIADRPQVGVVRPRRSVRSHRRLGGAALATVDAAVFAAVLAIVGSQGLAPALALIGAAVLGLNLGAGLYPADRLHTQEILRRRVLIFGLTSLLILGCGGAVIGDWQSTLRAEAFLVTALALQWPARRSVRAGLHSAGLWGTPTEFLASPSLMPKLQAYFATHPDFGLIPALGSAKAVAVCQMPDPATTARLHQRYDEVIVLADLPDLHIGVLNPADIGGAIGLRIGRSDQRGNPVLKRAIDLAIAVPALIVATPLVLLGAIAIWIIDPGPAHYIQEREGLGGRKLRIPKLRTMYRDAESRLQDLLQADPAARAEWQSHFKLRDDPRILPGIGRFLRMSSIDELPQLISVIAGDMSIVGPRPFPDYHLTAMPVSFRAKRCSVLPGITGLLQISARSDADIVQQQQLDEHYIDNRSVWLDLQIVLGTFAALIGRRGAY